MFLPAFVLPLVLTAGVGVSATLETGTWHCPKYIHYYSNTTAAATSTNHAPPCNDTSASTTAGTQPQPVALTKPKPARDYKPACCDAFSFPANSNGEFGGTSCYTAWPVEGRRKGQFTCFLDEVVDGVGLRTKQGEEACCYDVDGLERDYVCVGVVY